MKTIKVNLGEHSYDIVISEDYNALDNFVMQFNKIILITDTNVESLYGNILDKFNAEKLVVPAGETSKSHKYLTRLYEQMAERKVSRRDLIVALGGGVVGDLTGYAAATFMRGVPYIQIPTSLLAQVDSSVGGKVAVNMPQGKNLVGSFYQPKMVYINPRFLETLSPRIFSDGMAEVIKYGAIASDELFNMLDCDELDMAEIIGRCCDIKRNIVEKDQYDMGERMMLNFGHTMGHSIENYYNYEKYTHGEAVAIGMYNVTCASERMGITKVGTAEKIKRLLERYNLPYQLDIPVEKLIMAMHIDKKASGKEISLILLEDIGKAVIKTIDKTELMSYMGATQ